MHSCRCRSLRRRLLQSAAVSSPAAATILGRRWRALQPSWRLQVPVRKRRSHSPAPRMRRRMRSAHASAAAKSPSPRRPACRHLSMAPASARRPVLGGASSGGSGGGAGPCPPGRQAPHASCAAQRAQPRAPPSRPSAGAGWALVSVVGCLGPRGGGGEEGRARRWRPPRSCPRRRARARARAALRRFPPHPTPPDPTRAPAPPTPPLSRSRGGGPARPARVSIGASGNARTQTDPHERGRRRPARVVATASAPGRNSPQAGSRRSDDRRAAFAIIFISQCVARARARARLRQVPTNQARAADSRVPPGAAGPKKKCGFVWYGLDWNERALRVPRAHTPHRFRIIAWDQSRSRPRVARDRDEDARRCGRWVRAPGRPGRG